ncbi:uncharacterized protein LOC114243025 [Bombyx mandarina]|uniref:Uncharacterized protein LOC114243025 n=1 Tax=Bombyx mandarina TaxID=7092 RepID=A0A6J2JLM5_BOMMA|nr:uncharacterized protein LOC114243025 [Bombyx mandarina]
METFKFSNDKKHVTEAVFNGSVFYEVYKYADFLKEKENVAIILAKAYDLRQRLKEVKPGQCIKVQDMYIIPELPLMIKKTGPNVALKPSDFTINRLTGLTAAFAFQNRRRFPQIFSSEAHAIGLEWDNAVELKCRLYLSAVSGAEHFLKIFGVYPLVCALKKYQMKKLPLELVIKAGKIKNEKGERMASVLQRNNAKLNIVWTMFPDTGSNNLSAILMNAPAELKALFRG